jgi:uncharacterized protein
MIVSFSVENWMSFQEVTTLSMTATTERQHKDRVPRVQKYKTGILPVATIYGGNASGKTNFFKALNFVKKLILDGTKPDSLIPVEPFMLDQNSMNTPSKFKLELLIDEFIYEFSFAITRKKVLEEKLIKISSSSEKVLYHRKEENLNFDKSLDNNRFLHFAFQGTRDNQLFLTNSVSQKVEEFYPVYDWFKNTLKLIAPDSRFEPFESFLDEDIQLDDRINEILSQLDTGISHLGYEEIAFETLPFSEKLKSLLQEDVNNNTTGKVYSPSKEQIVVSQKEGKLIAKKLCTYHKESKGKDVKFEMAQESDGSRRIIELLPSFLSISSGNSNKVYVIDEVDRSLHSLLTIQLLKLYLDSLTTESRSQLLLTTHDMMLMDQKYFRRDEMWIVERNSKGGSTLFSFSDFKNIRYDKDIRKSYLQGRLGGIPNISIHN